MLCGVQDDMKSARTNSVLARIRVPLYPLHQGRRYCCTTSDEDDDAVP